MAVADAAESVGDGVFSELVVIKVLGQVSKEYISSLF
jgi:hypothetical protein